MKLIIDIPDSDYERIKDLVETDTKYTTATTVGTAYQVIANGIPVSNDGDLISREALKKEMDRPFWEKWEWEFICKSIDNAPTVTDRTEEVLSLQNTIAKLVEGIAEQEKLVIIRAKIMLDKVELQYFRDKFKKEYEEGLIVLPEYFEVTVHDVIRDVKIEGGST